MFVLDRCVGQSITLEGVGLVRVIRIKDGRVHLGFEMPRSVSIRRSELPPIEETHSPASKAEGRL